jgi:hypothetical protein
MLAEKAAHHPHGRASFAILLFQDIAAIPAGSAPSAQHRGMDHGWNSIDAARPWRWCSA